MRKPMTSRITAVTVLPEGEPLFHVGATVISLADEAAGEYVHVTQCRDDEAPGISIDAHEWPMIRAEIDAMIGRIREIGDA